MSIFSRRRAAPAPMPAPPPPAPVAQPAMPNPYLRNLPPAQPQQPRGQFDDGSVMGRAANMLSKAGALGSPQQPGMQQTVGPGLTPQGNLFNPMQQPGQRAPLGGMPLGMQAQPPSYMQSPEFQGYMTQAQDLRRQMDEYMQKAPMYQQMQDLQGKMQQYQQQYQQQPYMPQPMTMDIPAGQQFAGNPMEMQQAAQQYAQMQMQQRQFPQPGQMGQMTDLQRAAMEMQQRQAQMGQQPMQNAVFGGNLGTGTLGAQAMAQQPGMQPQQPNSLGQQFGQAQNPFARPLQPQQPNSPGQQQTGPFAGPAKLQQLGTAPQQPGMQPQQPGMQQNSPMQKAGGSTGRTGLF